MISELMVTYIFDRLDKQIIKKVPYALLISLIIYSLFDMKPFLLPLSAAFLVIFTTLTIIFNSDMNKALEGLLIDVKDLKRLVEKLSKIFEGKNSFLDDIKASENWKLILLGVLSGFSFTSLLVIVFLMIFDYFAIEEEFSIPIMIILLIYAYQDLAGGDMLKEYQTKETETTFMEDIAEAYLITNSLKSFPMETPTIAALKLASRIIGPICHLLIPRLHSETFFVYYNPEIKTRLIELTDENNKLYLKCEVGQSIENLFTANWGSIEDISVLSEKSPKKVFPYLLDPSYEFSQEKDRKWAGLSIIEQEKRKKRIKGYLFIHMFKGIVIKKGKPEIIKKRGKYREKRMLEPADKLIVLFILIGERKYVEYLKTTIEITSIKCSPNIVI